MFTSHIHFTITLKKEYLNSDRRSIRNQTIKRGDLCLPIMEYKNVAVAKSFKLLLLEKTNVFFCTNIFQDKGSIILCILLLILETKLLQNLSYLK